MAARTILFKVTGGIRVERWLRCSQRPSQLTVAGRWQRNSPWICTEPWSESGRGTGGWAVRRETEEARRFPEEREIWTKRHNAEGLSENLLDVPGEEDRDQSLTLFLARAESLLSARWDAGVGAWSVYQGMQSLPNPHYKPLGNHCVLVKSVRLSAH